MRRNIMRQIFPVIYIGFIILLIPYFDTAFTSTLSYLRVELGKVALTTGVATEEKEIFLGIYKPEVPYSFQRLESLEGSINRKFDIISFYQTWGERSEDMFPQDMMREIDRHGSVAMITWEPWLTEFKINNTDGASNTKTDLRSIANGKYDKYIREWAKESVVYGKPFFLRFAHEMNNPQYPWSEAAGNRPKDFIDSWKHVHRIFKDEGAMNVLFVWSPQGIMPNEFYPGGEYVDWIGAGIFNYGSYAEDIWHSFEYVYEPIYRSAIRYDKPIMIAEIGCSPLGGNQMQWYSDAFKMISKTYPETKAVVLFNNPADFTLAGSIIDWSIDNNPEILQLLRNEADDGIFKSKFNNE
jgi:hypothetical protein